MGLYDTLVDGDKGCQVKMFDCLMQVYKTGDEIIEVNGESFIISFPKYEEAKFAIIKEGIFIKLTDTLLEEEKELPRYTKWGHKIDKSITDIEDLNPIKIMIDNLGGK